MVAEHFFGLHVVVSYIYKAGRHILESVYNMPLVKYKYQSVLTFLTELGQKHLFFGYVMVYIDINRKGNKLFFFKEINVAYY